MLNPHRPEEKANTIPEAHQMEIDEGSRTKGITSLDEEIEKTKLDDYTEERVTGDGRCLFYSILIAAGLDINFHHLMREKTLEWIKERNHDNSVFSEDEHRTQEEYLNMMSNTYAYGGFIEIEAIATKLKCSSPCIYPTTDIDKNHGK